MHTRNPIHSDRAGRILEGQFPVWAGAIPIGSTEPYQALAAAERIWFQRTLAGRRLEHCTGHAIGGDGSLQVPTTKRWPR